MPSHTIGANAIHWRAPLDPGGPVVLFCHGSGGAADQFSTLGGFSDLRGLLISAGVGWIECTGGGATSWGNQAARDDYEEAFEYVDSVADIGDVVVFGRSMGGVVGSWLYTQSTVVGPRSVGYINNSGVQSLPAFYDSTTSGVRDQMHAAYGVTDLPGFLSAIEGRDPLDDFAASLYAGKSILQTAGDADVTVPPNEHAYPMRAKYAGQPTIDLLTVKAGATHATSYDGPITDAHWAFIAEVTNAVGPQPAPKTYLTTVRRYLVDGPDRYALTPTATA